jgi:hypothetical protein
MAVSAPTKVSTRSCVQIGSFFSVQIAGNVDGTYWGRIHRDVFAPIPDRKAMVALWSFGSPQPVLRAWIAHERSRISARCPASSARAPERGDLRPPLRVKDGWAYGRRYECRQRGRFVVRTETLRSGTRMTVWMEKSRELIAVAEVTGASGWLRSSKRCTERSV